jgi:hypothetical protein
MVSCDRIEDYFAGVLQGDNRVSFEGHLEACLTCRNSLKHLVLLDKELRETLPSTLPDVEPSSDWIENLVQTTLDQTKR